MNANIIPREEASHDEDDKSHCTEDLENFRSQWKNELKVQQKTGTGSAEQYQECIEAQAKALFMEGVRLEYKKDLFGAVQCYRRAVQLVPDIESTIEEFKYPKIYRDRLESETSVTSSDYNEDLDDLVSHFNKLRMLDDETVTCLPRKVQQTTHISALPIEVLLYIFRWVISDKHDFRTLEQISMVCRGFYLHTRDDELWKLACLRLWGNHCGRLDNYGTWRDMFIERPHLSFHGCYISKTSYYRQGEPSLDSFYKPWLAVEYYRFIRFFPDGYLVMYTCADDPQTIVAKLQRNVTKLQGALCGHYKLVGNLVTAVLKNPKLDNVSGYTKRRRQIQQKGEKENLYQLEFIIKDGRQKKNNKLYWQQYSLSTKNRLTGNETSHHEFELTKTTFPALYFTPVRGYTACSERPLQ